MRRLRPGARVNGPRHGRRNLPLNDDPHNGEADATTELRQRTWRPLRCPDAEQRATGQAQSNDVGD